MYVYNGKLLQITKWNLNIFEWFFLFNLKYLAEEHMPHLSPTGKSDSSDYINAVYLPVCYLFMPTKFKMDSLGSGHVTQTNKSWKNLQVLVTKVFRASIPILWYLPVPFIVCHFVKTSKVCAKKSDLREGSMHINW